MNTMMPFLPEKLITYRNSKLMKVIKQVPMFAVETVLKFVMRKIAVVTETQFVKRMKNITHFFRKKKLHEPICTSVT